MNNYIMKISKYMACLFLIVGAALVLRLWQLGDVPLSPDWDEAALGYNAYSLFTTGKDEYGAQLPVVLKSFGDYKPALYAYLIIPLIPLFDITLFAVRLPSVIAGIVGIIGMYFLVKQLLASEKLGIVAAFLFAISPWHLQLSRVAFEANVGLTCIILTVLFFLYGLKQGRFLMISAFFAALGLYTYQSEKVFLPLLLLSLVIIYRKELLALPRKWLVGAFITGIVFSLPISLYMIENPESVARARMTSVISRGDSILERSAKRLIRDKQDGDIAGQIFNDRRIVYGKAMLNGYIAHFDPNWLFITGDMPRHHAPGMGLLYIWELPFLIIGFIGILSIKNRKSLMVILAWLLLAPIPAALTFDVPHAVRTLQLLPVLLVLSAFGLWVSYSTVIKSRSNKVVKLGAMGVFGVFVISTFLYYVNQYFVQQNYFYAKDWQYGYKEAVSSVREIKKNYKDVIVSSEVPMDQSYIFFLYYLKYPPEKYHTEQGNDPSVRSFDMYTFRKLDLEKDKNSKNTLLVGSSRDFPKEVDGIKTVRYPDGTEAIKLVDPSRL
jgi:4-amino-4-deoxy-L-arabinose transferase-like glycosyltransferase